MVRLLITDIQYRKTFDVINILKHTFPTIDCILGISEHFGAWKARLCYGMGSLETIRTSKYDTFEADLNRVSEKYNADTLIYIPVEEITTDYFIDFIAKNGKKNFKYLLPDADLYKKFRNKNLLNEFCLEHSFPAPQKYNSSKLALLESYPIILKPSIGSGSHGIVRLLDNGELSEHLKHEVEEGRYVAQELIPDGKNVHGVFLLYENGKRLGAYTHRRLRTSPEEGGVTVLSEMTCEKALIEQASNVLDYVGWNGLVMLEYLWDEKSKTYKLIEANPRLWGSIMLAEYGGAYLLTNYVRICIGERILQCKPNEGVKIRWFFPMDLLFLIKKKGFVKGFWNFSNTCFINWTYAGKLRAFSYLILSVFSKENICKLLGKI